MERGGRKTYLDAVRIFASFAVIYNHVFGYRFFDAPGLWGIAAQLAFFLSKIAVPLFFMISGLLLLPREDSYRKTFSRILRIGVVLVGMCAFYYAVDLLQKGGTFDWRVFVQSVYRYEPVNSNAFWFLYRYLSILVMLPILQRMVCGLGKKAIGWLLFLSLLVGSAFPIVWKQWPQLIYNENLDIPLFSAYIAMLLMGLCTERYLGVSKRGALLAAGGVVLFTSASVILIRLDASAYDAYGNLFYDNCILLPILAAAGCAFYLAKCLGTTPRAERVDQTIAAVGRLTFCVYLFGDFFINLLDPMRATLTQGDASYLGTLLYAGMAYVLSLLLAAVLTRVPGLKKLL